MQSWIELPNDEMMPCRVMPYHKETLPHDACVCVCVELRRPNACSFSTTSSSNVWMKLASDVGRSSLCRRNTERKPTNKHIKLKNNQSF